MRTDPRTLLPLVALLVAACMDIPDPAVQTPPPDEMGSTPPPAMDEMDEGRGGGPSVDPSVPPVMVRRSCQVAGATYPDGSSVPSGDRCNLCTCSDASVVCTQMLCEPEECENFLEEPDGLCSRPADDPCIAQDPDCAGPGPDPEEPVCEAGGQSFAEGAEVPSGDSCNTCRCEDADVSCTEIACEPVFCAEFVEEPDGVCSRFPLDPCSFQDPECAGAPPPDLPLPDLPLPDLPLPQP